VARFSIWKRRSPLPTITVPENSVDRNKDYGAQIEALAERPI